MFGSRTQILSILALAGSVLNAPGTQSVIDHTAIAQSAAQEVVNLAKYVTTATKQSETALNTLNQYEQMLLYVARFGNPAALRNLPGVSTVAELYQLYGQLSRDYTAAQAFLSPDRYQADMNSILRTYQLPQWNGFSSASGSQIIPTQGVFQFPTASWNVANSAQQQLKTLDDQRQRLQQQRDQALKSLQSATTVSDVEKYHAVINSLNGAIGEVAHAEQELYHRTGYQNQELQAGQQIYNASQAERRAAAVYQGIDRDLSALPVQDFHQGARWGQ